eukprot:m.246591 g.246591  ORF g.246591 m.246591 type:complete len:138 (+) comp15381_c0_seq7:360-773(+)
MDFDKCSDSTSSQPQRHLGHGVCDQVEAVSPSMGNGEGQGKPVRRSTRVRLKRSLQLMQRQQRRAAQTVYRDSPSLEARVRRDGIRKNGTDSGDWRQWQWEEQQSLFKLADAMTKDQQTIGIKSGNHLQPSQHKQLI